jgi:hypothetical protein
MLDRILTLIRLSKYHQIYADHVTQNNCIIRKIFISRTLTFLKINEESNDIDITKY